jgi:hypothetical protein
LIFGMFDVQPRANCLDDASQPTKLTTTFKSSVSTTYA